MDKLCCHFYWVTIFLLSVTTNSWVLWPWLHFTLSPVVFKAQFCQWVESEECRHHVIAEVTAHSPWKSWLCVYISPQLCISDVPVVTETHQWECVCAVGLRIYISIIPRRHWCCWGRLRGPLPEGQTPLCLSFAGAGSHTAPALLLPSQGERNWGRPSGSPICGVYTDGFTAWEDWAALLCFRIGSSAPPLLPGLGELALESSPFGSTSTLHRLPAYELRDLVQINELSQLQVFSSVEWG